jgi:hypothetical protein
MKIRLNNKVCNFSALSAILFGATKILRNAQNFAYYQFLFITNPSSCGSKLRLKQVCVVD